MASAKISSTLRLLMKISVVPYSEPFSRRVRYLSRRGVDQRFGATFPTVRRIRSWGILDLSSYHSVSRMPVLASSLTSW
ncbi:hypothetical protein D3C83_71250 [compost metagenome]